MPTAVASSQDAQDFADKIPFTKYDFGWVVLCVGMAIGSGIVFMPVQIGLKGLWVFIVAVLIAYPGVFQLQSIFLKTLTETDECEDYTGIITQYLGRNWGAILSVFYFLLLSNGMMVYSTAVSRDSASYLQTYGITTSLLSETLWYPFALMVGLVAIAAQGEKLLFKVSGPMVIVKLGIILLLGVIMVPHWNFNNITAFPPLLPFLRDVLLTIPFAVFSIIFMPILSPMNIAYRKEEPNRRIATYRAMRASNVAYIVLVISVLFFALSFTFSLSHEQAVEAFNNNISALAIAAQVIPGSLFKVITTALNLFALITAFFALYLGFQESIKGVAFNIISRFVPKENINKQVLHYAVMLVVTVGLWLWILCNAKVLFILQLGAPLFGVVACFIPCYLVYKIPSLNHLKGPRTYLVILFGIILCASPLFKFFE